MATKTVKVVEVYENQRTHQKTVTIPKEINGLVGGDHLIFTQVGKIIRIVKMQNEEMSHGKNKRSNEF